MKLFIILGNQLFNPKYLSEYKDHTFFMAEDYGLCTFEKHHKLKILLFLSSMRSFKDELKSKIANFILKNEKMADSIAKMHPLKRVGEGSDSASVANFLLSDNSSWITGQILGVDGGRSSLT